MNKTAALSGKTALVTGSTSGIGLGIAHALAASGCRIIIQGLADSSTIQELKNAFQQQYQQSILVDNTDLSDATATRHMMKRLIQETGGIDILVNNAGIQHVATTQDFPVAKWDQILAINLSSAFHTIAEALPYMQQKAYGRIINIASAHGLVASANKSAYVAAKHGLLGLTKVVALENATNGITCNAICPGWVLTPLVEKQLEAIATRDQISMEEAKIRLLSEKQPAKAFVTPDQIGSLAVFLCSDEAHLMTGGSLSMDGGWTAQ